MKTLVITDRQFHSILAGLRALQSLRETFKQDEQPDSVIRHLVRVANHDTIDIASNSGVVEPLNAEEIDNLCEKINR